MTRMWRGPCPELKAAYSDKLFADLARRCGRQNVFFVVDHSGYAASAYTLYRGRREWMGDAGGADPIATAIAISYEFTEADAELYSLHAIYLARQAEQIVALARAEAKLCAEIEALAGALHG